MRRWLSSFAWTSLAFAWACGPDVDVRLAEPGGTPDPVLSDADARDRDLAPIRMRSTRGIPLRLAKLEVGAVVEDPLAFTELRMVFENPEPTALAGELEIELPLGARVTRFASRDGDSWREAEVVGRKPAATSGFLDVATDPQLADAIDRRVFRATIPGIAGRARQEVVLSYTEVFTEAGGEYRVRLAGLSKMRSLDTHVLVTETIDDPTTAIDERGTQRVLERAPPGQDLVLRLSREPRTGVRHRNMVVARINPISHDHPEPLHGLTVLFDTSASRAVGFESSIRRLGHLMACIERFAGGHMPLRLVAFDQTFQTVYEGRLDGFEAASLQALRERAPLGASNLRAAIGYVGSRPGAGLDRVLLFSDGVATAGPTERSSLESAVRSLADAGVVRLDAITDGGIADRELLSRLANALPRHGLVLDAAADPEQVTRRLLRRVTDDVRLEVPGARWYYPERIDGIQSSDEVLVYADIDGEGALEVHSHSAHDRDLVHEVPLTRVEPHLVASAWMSGRVAFLADTLRRSSSQPLVYRRKAWEHIVQLSTRHRVLNEWTTLEVASRADSRTIDSDVLVAGPLGVQILQREVVVDEGGPGQVLSIPRLAVEPLDVHELLLLAEHEPDEPTPAGAAAASAARVSADGAVTVQAMRSEVPSSAPVPRPPMVVAHKPHAVADGVGPQVQPSDAYSGNLLAVMNLLGWGRVEQATEIASAWREAEPGDVMALVALGESLEASERPLQASRVYGSIIDLFPQRADMRRFAGQRLERLGAVGSNLALDTYNAARAQRPDHASSHRLYAFALLRAGESELAFEVLANALLLGWREEQFGAVEKVLREDLGLVAASWIGQRPEHRPHVLARLQQLGAVLPTRPSLRFVLTWETSGNDVDLHVRDGDGHHAYYENPVLESGGMLYGDVKEGFGPEAFAITSEPRGYPYHFLVHYYARGPLGYGMGKLEIIEHDGNGTLKFDERPFVVTKDRAYADLGVLSGPL